MVGIQETYDGRLGLLLLAPLLGAILSFILGGKTRHAAGIIASSAVAVSFALTVSAWAELTGSLAFTATLGSWISAGSFSMPLDLYFDHLSAVMCLVVTGVGLLIHVYSIGYMCADAGRARFFAYLNLFISSMLLLVLGKSLPVIFIGWEGVGLCSYLLIGFWFDNREFTVAGRKAFVMNRIGDVGFIIAMMVLFSVCGTLDITKLRDPEILGKLTGSAGLLAGLALFFAATGKSAQIPLFTWLPDAMAGPTPVSALIHAATMVTAGVYLMGRMSGVIEVDPLVPAIIIWTALATAVLAGTVALVQSDIKKVLAYSTVSQLGFMFLAVGAGYYPVAIFHVVTHAFFKACLFLSAGSVIHGCHHEQDMRRMGGLAKSMPLTCASYGVATLAIAGIFPFAGFFSKHAILEGTSTINNPYLLGNAGLVTWTATAVAVLTALYMGRSFVLTFLGTYRGAEHPHEAPMVMVAPVLVLAALSVVGGWFLNHELLGYLAPSLPSLMHEEPRLGFVDSLVGSLPGLLGLAAAYLLFARYPSVKEAIRKVLQPFETLLRGAYYVDELFGHMIVKPLYGLARTLYTAVDQSFIDGGVFAVGYISSALGELTRRSTTGQVRTYVLFMFIAASVLLGIFVQR